MIYLLFTAAVVVLALMVSSHLALHRTRAKQAIHKLSDSKAVRFIKWLVHDPGSRPASKGKTVTKLYQQGPSDS